MRPGAVLLAKCRSALLLISGHDDSFPFRLRSSAMRELVTLQFGPLANYAGAHLWNLLDEYAANHEDEGDAAASDIFSRDVLMRRACVPGPGGSMAEREVYVPRLVLVDRQGGMGIIGSRGFQYADADPLADVTQLAGTVSTWDGAVRVTAADPLQPHDFVRQMREQRDWGGYYVARASARRSRGHWGGDEDDEDEEWDEDEEEEDERGAYGRQSQRAHAAYHPAHGAAAAEPQAHELGQPTAEEGAPAAEDGVSASHFRFEQTVSHWADYLQLDVHPRALHVVQHYEHGYSRFDGFEHGRELFDASGAGGAGAAEATEALLDRVRRELEACDRPQGLLALVDVDGAFGGVAQGTLLAAHDELGCSDVLCFGLQRHSGGEEEAEGEGGALDEGDAEARQQRATRRGHNHARALHCLSEVCSLYAPLCVPPTAGESADAGGAHPAQAFAHVRGALRSRYEVSALMAAAIDCATSPARAVGSPQHTSLAQLCAAARPVPAARISALSLALPCAPAECMPAGAWSTGTQLCPLIQASARLVRAHAHIPPSALCLSARGCEDAVRARVSVAHGVSAAERGWAQSRAEGAWWAAPAAGVTRAHAVRLHPPLELPVAFPQLFAPSVDRRGLVPRRDAARPSEEEVFALPALTRLESAAVLGLGIRDAARALRASTGAVAKRGGGGGGASSAPDEEGVAEAAEELAQLAEDYAEMATVGSEALLAQLEL